MSIIHKNHILDWRKCGVCQSTRIQHFGVRLGEGTVICLSCGAKWWKHWYTKKEWKKTINTDS